jgi:hypothetical protein
VKASRAGTLTWDDSRGAQAERARRRVLPPSLTRAVGRSSTPRPGRGEGVARAGVGVARTPGPRGVARNAAPMGHVEHIPSGRALRFQSPEDLWTFLTQVLDNPDEKPP